MVALELQPHFFFGRRRSEYGVRLARLQPNGLFMFSGLGSTLKRGRAGGAVHWNGMNTSV